MPTRTSMGIRKSGPNKGTLKKGYRFNSSGRVVKASSAMGMKKHCGKKVHVRGSWVKAHKDADGNRVHGYYRHAHCRKNPRHQKPSGFGMTRFISNLL